MSIRLSGLVSGMDTDSLVQELVKAYSTKKDDLVKAQTKLSWTQDKWKAANTKIYSFYGKTLSNMRFSSNYNTKATSVSDTSKASVIAGEGAVSGSQSLAVKQLAKAGYLTGGKITTKISGDSITPTAGTTLADLGVTADSTFTLTSGGKDYTINLNTTSQLSDIATQLTDAGVGASYDATNQRFFINAKTTGKDSDFSLTADSATAISSMTAIGIYTSSDATQNPAYTTWANYYVLGDPSATISNMSDIIDTEVAKRIAENQAIITNAQTIKNTSTAYLASCGSDSNELYLEAKNKLTDPVTLLNDYGIAADSTLSDSEKIATILTKDLEDANATGSTATAEEKAALVTAVSLATNVANANTNITNADAAILTANTNIASAPDDVKEEYFNKSETAYNIVNGIVGSTGASTAVRINGQDAEIFLNGAHFTSTSNTFSINGLTITAKETTGLKTGETDADNPDNYNTVSLTTDIDVSGIYDNIKNFFKEYNTLIKELDSMYGASSSKGYEPLTSDEKDAMTDTEIEEWEKKIKDSLLRRDDTLDGVINSMKTAMTQTYTIDGSVTSLSTYGINTLSYFLSGDDEKGVFHINGDSDDTSTSAAADKLKTAIAKDPESVASFFQQLSSGLYEQLSKKMSSTSMSSAYTVYNDKQMKIDYDDYKTKISDQEKKLKNIEDKYYKQFSAMEAAMAKLNSSQSALSGLLGNS